MTELAPGFRVDEFVQPGTILKVARQVWPDGEVLCEATVAVNPADWERVPGARREAFLDDLTRRAARAGIEEIEAMLRAVWPPSPAREEDR